MPNHRINGLKPAYQPINLDSFTANDYCFASAVFHREKLQSFLTEKALHQMEKKSHSSTFSRSDCYGNESLGNQ